MNIRKKFRKWAFKNSWWEHPFDQLRELLHLFSHQLRQGLGSIGMISKHGQFDKHNTGQTGFYRDIDESYRLNLYDDNAKYDKVLNKRMGRFNDF